MAFPSSLTICDLYTCKADEITARVKTEMQELEHPGVAAPEPGTRLVHNGENYAVTSISPDGVVIMREDEEGNNSLPEVISLDTYYAEKQAEIDAQEQQPQSGENGEAAQETASPAEEEPAPVSGGGAVQEETALGRMPKDEQGQPLYEQADAETAWDAIMEQAGGDEAMAQEVANEIVSEQEKALKAAERELKKVQDGKPQQRKGDAPLTVEARIAAKQAVREQTSRAQVGVDEARKRLEAWRKIAETSQRRRQAIEAERRQEEQEAGEVNFVREDTVGGSPVALSYLLENGKGGIESSGYFLHGVAAAFPELTGEIESIRSKYLSEIDPSPRGYASSGHSSISEIRDLISRTYGERGVSVFDRLLQNADGFVPKDGKALEKEIEDLRPLPVQGGESLSDEEVDLLMGRMEENATQIPQIELNPANWLEQFGDDGTVATPLGTVKMGDNQIAKLFEKGRSEQFGMIKPTLELPHVVIEVQSNSKDGNQERDTSLLFIRSFIGKEGKKKYYFKSVTVKKDGLEVSISSHFDREKRVRESLKNGKLLYRFDGDAQTEHPLADVSVTASQAGPGAFLIGKDSEKSEVVQENSQLSQIEQDVSDFPFTYMGQQYVVRPIKTDDKGRYTDWFNGKTVRVDNAPEEATMAVFSPNGIVFEGYAARDNAGGEYKLWYKDGKLLDKVPGTEAERRRQAIEAAQKLEDEVVDNQGNPIGKDGRLIIEKVNSIEELTDEDFTNPTRSVELPQLPEAVSDAIGANGKPVVIKKNIFEKNKKTHRDLSAQDSRGIIKAALYSPQLYGQNKKTSRPFNWILIHLADKHSSIVIEVNNNKDNYEIVGWHYLDEEALQQKRNQAVREGGLILTIPQSGSAAGNAPENSKASGNKDSETRPILDGFRKNNVNYWAFREIRSIIPHL